jgi:hypothetical protein
VKGLSSEHMCAARRASRYGSTGMQDRRRDGYEMAFEGIRLVLSSTPPDDPARVDLVDLYHSLGRLAERGALQLAPLGEPDVLAVPRHGAG